MFLLILLDMLSAFGPFVTDMYLLSLPAMTDYFSTNSSMVQLGLTTSMIGLALGQVFLGPLSDKYGRRPLLLVSMILFVVSTIFCLFALDIYSFVTLRLVQGIGGAGGIVISRSVATDKFPGKEFAKILAVIGDINGFRTPLCWCSFSFTWSIVLCYRWNCFSLSGVGQHPYIYRSNVCNLRHLFLAVCIVGSKTTDSKGGCLLIGKF